MGFFWFHPEDLMGYFPSGPGLLGGESRLDAEEFFLVRQTRISLSSPNAISVGSFHVVELHQTTPSEDREHSSPLRLRPPSPQLNPILLYYIFTLVGHFWYGGLS